MSVPKKMNPSALAEEALRNSGDAPGASGSQGSGGEVGGKGKGGGKGKKKRKSIDEIAKDALALVPVGKASRDALDIEGDVEFTPEGAVLDERGYLRDLYYKAFISSFKDKEIALMDPAAGTGWMRA